MKPYMVVKAGQGDFGNFPYRHRGNGFTGIAYPLKQPEIKHINDWVENQNVYMADTEADANEIVRYLMEMYPQNSYIIAKSEMAFYRPIGDRKTAKFTKDGMVPA